MEGERDVDATSSNTVFYCVRVKSLLFSRYLKDMNVLTLEVLEGKNYEILGKARVGVREGADRPVIADGLFTIFASDGGAIGKLRAQLVVDYFETPVLDDHSFEELENIIEMDTPLPLQHSKIVPLYKKVIAMAPTGGSLPPLLRSSVASVGGYEGSSEEGYLDVDASMSEDASILRPKVEGSIAHSASRNIFCDGDCTDSSEHNSNDDADNESVHKYDCSDSQENFDNRLQHRSNTDSTAAAFPRSVADVSLGLNCHEHVVSQNSDSASPTDKDESMIRAACYRSVALQHSSISTSPPRSESWNVVPTAPQASVHHNGNSSTAINTSRLHDASGSHLRHDSAAQTSPFAFRAVSVSEASVDANLPECALDIQSRFAPLGPEQTVNRSPMTDQKLPVHAAKPPPAWNNILDSLSARLGAMRSRVIMAEQKLNPPSSLIQQKDPHFLSHPINDPAFLSQSTIRTGFMNERIKSISNEDEPLLGAKLHVSPYSPVRGGDSSIAASVSDGAFVGENRTEAVDNFTLSELADVFNSQDEAALLTSLFFAKAQQPSISKQRQQSSPAHLVNSPSARNTTLSSGCVGMARPSPSAIRQSAEIPKPISSTPTRVTSDIKQQPKLFSTTTSIAQVDHSWFVSVDSVSFLSAGQKVSVKDVRVVIKVPNATTLREFISPSIVRVRWLGSRLPRHSLSVVFVDAAQSSQRVTVPSAPAVIIEVWERDTKTLEPRIVGLIRCPIRAGVSSSPAGSRIKKLTSSGVWAAVLDSGNFIYDGTTSIRSPLSGMDVGHASISILQQNNDIVDAVVRATDAVLTISSAVRCHICRKIFKTLQMRLQKISMRRELRISRPVSRRAAVEIASDSSITMFSYTFKVEVQGLFGIGDWSGASSVCIRARFPGQKEWMESGRTAIVKGSAAALASSTYSWVLPANQHLSSALTDADSGVSAGLCIQVHDGVDSRRLNPPMRQYCLPINEILAQSGAAMEMCLSNRAPNVPNGGVKKVCRIPAREFGQGCVLKVVLQCKVSPTTASNLVLTSLSNSSHPKLIASNNSLILGVICASGLQTAAEHAIASSHPNSSLAIAKIDGINAFATVAFTPPASHLLPGLNGSHIYVTNVVPMTFAPKWDWKIQFPLQLSREICSVLAASSLTVSVYHRPLSRVRGQREEDVLIGHAAAPLAHIFSKHSGLATWVPLVSGTSGLPTASVLLFSNIEATTGEPKKECLPVALLCDAYDVHDTAGLTGIFEASLEELIVIDGCVVSLLGASKFASAKITWRLPGLDVMEVQANFSVHASGDGPGNCRVISLQSSVSRTFDLSVDAAHCLNERAIEIDIALCSSDVDNLDPVALGTCYVDASPLLDRASQFELPTQARWSSGTFVVIHPSGSRCGAAVRVRLQLKFNKGTDRNQVIQPRVNVESLENSISDVTVRSPAPRALAPQLPALPVATASTLTLESVRHVQLPDEFESGSAYLSLTTILDGHILHNTAPILYCGKIEWEDVISLQSKTPDCDKITVLLSAQNEDNSKAAILGSSEIDLSMLQLMKCISGWYSILDSSGNCVAYVKLRIDTKLNDTVANTCHREELGFSCKTHPSDEPSANTAIVSEVDSPEMHSLTSISDRPAASEVQDFDVFNYSAPSLEDLRNKMKELDSVSDHLKRMLERNDSNAGESEIDLIDPAFSSSVFGEALSPSNAENAAPRALIAYAGRLREI
jgi:hypothetical protein